MKNNPDRDADIVITGPYIPKAAAEEIVAAVTVLNQAAGYLNRVADHYGPFTTLGDKIRELAVIQRRLLDLAAADVQPSEPLARQLAKSINYEKELRNA